MSVANTTVATGDSSSLPQQALENVTDPVDSDVLCGRGGAALRHPGNQTYRRLVNLNKGLYITCLKTEKLKISRSIVAAIREQKGRFLEKDTSDSSNKIWFDIGDKKAIEKTSQALREGQPKLRQKIVEMGGGISGTTALMESQFGPAGQQFMATNGNLYVTDPNAAVKMDQNSNHSGGSGMSGLMPSVRQQQERQSMHMQQHSQDFSQDLMMGRLSLHEHQAQDDSRYIHQQSQHRNRLRNSLNQRGSVELGSLSGDSQFSLMSELGIPVESQHSLLSEFSRYSNQGMGGGGSSTHPMPNESLMSMDATFRRALNNLQYSNHSVQSNFAPSVASVDSNNTALINNSFHNSVNTGGMASANTASTLNSMSVHSVNSAAAVANPTVQHQQRRQGLDRRRIFKDMKYSRPASDRDSSQPRQEHHAQQQHRSNDMGQSDPYQQNIMGNSSHLQQQNRMRDSSHHQRIVDGMPDVHMVESFLSLQGATMHSTGQHFSPPAAARQQQHLGQSNSNSNNGMQQQQPREITKVIIETAKVVDKSSSDNHEIRILPDALGSGSRHSLMSGLSRISDASMENSIFSDLSRKIGNVSTRSIAMSDISTINLEEVDGDDDNSSTDSGMDPHLAGVIADHRKQQATMEFDI